MVTSRHEYFSIPRFDVRAPAELSGKLTRCVADLAHLASIFILIHKIQKTRSCRGEFFVFCTFFA